jgi:hypothetical protein
MNKQTLALERRKKDMKKAGIIMVLLALVAGFSLGCGDDAACVSNPSGFQPCYVQCAPNDQACVSTCVDNWYCSDWGPFCGFGYVDYWGYCS